MKAVLFVAGIIMLTAACNKKDDDLTLDFDITVPPDWKYYVLSNDGVVYYAQSPLKASQNDTVSEDLVITKNEAKNMTLSSFYTAYVAELVDDTTYHPLTAVDTTISGEEAIKLTHLQTVYAVNQANGDTVHLDAKIQKYFMLNNNFGYVVSFNALTVTFDEYQDIFDNIIATFKFKN